MSVFVHQKYGKYLEHFIQHKTPLSKECNCMSKSSGTKSVIVCLNHRVLKNHRFIYNQIFALNPNLLNFACILNIPWYCFPLQKLNYSKIKKVQFGDFTMFLIFYAEDLKKKKNVLYIQFYGLNICVTLEWIKTHLILRSTTGKSNEIRHDNIHILLHYFFLLFVNGVLFAQYQ